MADNAVSTPISAPIVMVSAIASGQGKTTVTAALARHLLNRGKRVRVFKTGADFIDPMILAQACGAPVLSLDLWLLGLPACRRLLAQAAAESDIVLIEGVMGLYDGTPSSADLANAFGVPVMAVVDASSMAQTLGAVVMGLRDFGPVKMAGVIANRVASDGHLQMIKSALGDIPLLASLPRQEKVLPERHLGLVLPSEVAHIDDILDELAAQVLLQDNIWTQLPVSRFAEEEMQALALPRLLENKVIAIARDAAFAFLYPANLTCLQEMGGRLVYFSPLANEPIPDQADAVYLPGGYPELHGKCLSEAQQWIASIQAFHAAQKPIYAECGGMLSLVEILSDSAEQTWAMAGLLPGKITMQKRLAALGMQSMNSPAGELRGHTFHYSKLESDLPAADWTVRQRNQERGEAIYRKNGLHASYFHAYFPSNPAASAAFFLPQY
ncbi:cobyrinate a,c-diamide synthase [Undibacterium sp. Di24W]|uniref:cobyrinate a,c-diamide synthase n=1 Tax=Undibacterium sp. Di24W TaxID=3413033 RepID=UPI003BF42084